MLLSDNNSKEKEEEDHTPETKRISKPKYKINQNKAVCINAVFCFNLTIAIFFY